MNTLKKTLSHGKYENGASRTARDPKLARKETFFMPKHSLQPPIEGR